jgi:hypothetical protein
LAEPTVPRGMIGDVDALGARCGLEARLGLGKHVGVHELGVLGEVRV